MKLEGRLIRGTNIREEVKEILKESLSLDPLDLHFVLRKIKYEINVPIGVLEEQVKMYKSDAFVPSFIIRKKIERMEESIQRIDEMGN